MSRRLLPLLVLIPALLFAQPLPWTPQRPLTADRFEPSSGSEMAVASDGEEWYAVWSIGNAVVGNQIAADGSVASPVPTSFASTSWGSPAVVWHVDRYLVVWSRGEGLMGQWVSRDGEKIGAPAAIPSGFMQNAIAVSNGSEVLITARFARTVSVLQSDGTVIVLDEASLGISVSSAASDGESFLVIGSDSSGPVMAVRIAPSGEVLSSTVVAATLSGERPLIWNGAEYVLLGWRYIDARPALFALGLAPDGEIRWQRLLDDYLSTPPPLLASLADGSWLAGWAPFRQAPRFFRFNGEDRSEPLVFETSTLGHSAAASRDGLLIMWTEAGVVKHQPFDLDLRPRSEARVTAWGRGSQMRPAAIATDEGYFAAWEERTGQRSAIMGGIVGDSGVRGVRRLGYAESGAFAPALASSGDTVLLAWIESPDPAIAFRRFAADGSALDLEPTRISYRGSEFGVAPNDEPVAVAWNGSIYIVAWAERFDLRYVRITREGVLLDSEPLLVPQSTRLESGYPYGIPRFSAKLSTVGDLTLLVWQASRISGSCPIYPHCGPPLPPPRIEAVRLNREGHLIDGLPLIITGYDLAQGQMAPEVASDGYAFFVAFTDRATSSIRGATVSRSGRVSAATDLTRQMDPLAMAEALVFRRGEYILFWRSIRSTSPEAEMHSSGIDIEGGMRWSQPLAEVASSGWSIPNGAAAARDDGSVLVIYSRSDEAVGVAPHLWFRASGSLPEERGRRRPVGR